MKLKGISALLLCSVVSVSAQQNFIAYKVPAGIAGNQAIDGLGVGNDFCVVRPITISQLGVFDSETNGILGSASLSVQLYQRSGRSAGMLLETLSFDAANPGTRIGGSLFKPLTKPVILLPGHYTIVGYGFDTNNPEGNIGRPPYPTNAVPPWTTDDGGGLIQFEGKSRYGYGGVGLFPGRVDKGPANRYAAGTFIYSAATLAEPSYASDYASLVAGVSAFPLEDPRHLGSIAVIGDSAFPIIVEPGGNRRVLEAAANYNSDMHAGRAVAFSHVQWEMPWQPEVNDARLKLFENAIKWVSRKRDPGAITIGIATSFSYPYASNSNAGYFAQKGYQVVPVDFATLNSSNGIPTVDVLVVNAHGRYIENAVEAIQQFTAAGGGLVMSMTPRFTAYPNIRPAFTAANDILRPFGLAYRSSLSVPVELGFTNIQAIPYPVYFSAFPAAELLHQDRIGAIQLDSLARATALNTINYAANGQPRLLSELMAVYSGVTNNGTVPSSVGNVSFFDVVTLSGAQATTNRLGKWEQDGGDLVSTDRRGSVDYEINVPVSDVYRIRIEVTQNTYFVPSDSFPFGISLDGESLGRQNVDVTYGTVSTLEVMTPYLLSGTHQLRLLWDNRRNATSLRIKAVHVQAGMGADENGNGIKDWVDQLIRIQSGMDVTNNVISSYTSPVCLEGRDPYPWLVQMLLEGADSQIYSLNPKPLTDGRWFVNVPLSAYANAQLAFQGSYQNGALTESRTLQWTPINLFTATNMTVRRGDSLLLNALPANSPNGNLQISIGTNMVGSGRTTQPIACKFKDAGLFNVIGSYSRSSVTQSCSIIVKVVDVGFTNRPACWVGVERSWDVPGIGDDVVLQADGRLFCEQIASLPNGGMRFGLLADQSEPRSILARLGTGGPVLDTTRARGFNFWSGSKASLRVVEQYTDGSQLVEMLLILSPVYSDINIQIETVVGGVTFDDGTTIKGIPATDFDAQGRYSVRFIRPASARTSVCHVIKLYQGTELIGTLQ